MVPVFTSIMHIVICILIFYKQFIERTASAETVLQASRGVQNERKDINKNNVSALKPNPVDSKTAWRRERREWIQPAAAWPSPRRDIYQFIASRTVMQWSVLSESTIIHQALQIVPVLSWRGSRCAQIMSLTPSVWGVNRGGEVRHDALSSSKRKRFIVTSSVTSTKRHNHFIYSLNFLLSAHFAWVSFILSPAILYFSCYLSLFSVFLLSFILFCLPPFFYHPFSLSIFPCFTSYLYSLFIICLSFCSSLFPVFRPVMFDYHSDSLSSITLIALWLTRSLLPSAHPF